MSEKRTRSTFSPEIKAEALKMMAEAGAAATSEKMKIGKPTLANWRAQQIKESNDGKPKAAKVAKAAKATKPAKAKKQRVVIVQSAGKDVPVTLAAAGLPVTIGGISCHVSRDGICLPAGTDLSWQFIQEASLLV